MSANAKVLAAIVAASLASACSDAEEPAVDLPTLVGSIDLEIGADIGDAAYLFGRISGLAGDADGRIYVADAQAHEIRAFDADGSFLFAAGREGQGPGEFAQPCCLAFGPAGRLWVRDVDNARYQGFVVEPDGFVLDANVAKRGAVSNLWATLDFDDDGNLIDVVARSDPGATTPHYVRIYRTLNGEVAGEDSLVEPDPDELAMYTITTGSGVGAIRRFFYQPFGPVHLIAHGPDRWAQAVSSRYLVTVHQRGAEPFTINGEVGPIPLSPAELERAEERMARDRERIGGSLPFDIPDYKPPLRALFFDRARNLWVELTVAENADRQADVYGPDGGLIARRIWPAAVGLDFSGWVSGDVALGSGIDADGVPKVFRVRFR